jgi:Ca2+-binding RTX toxin-like protein
MGRRRKRGILLALFVAACAAMPTSAAAAPGDVFVADLDTGAGDPGAVLRVGPGGGATSVFATDAVLFEEPWGMVMNRDRGFLVADYMTDKILRVSRGGAVTEFFSDPSQAGITDLAWGPDGKLYVIDYITHNIFRLNPRTKAFQEIADNGGIPEWDNAFSIVVARDRTIYFTDGGDELWKVSRTGAVSKLYEGPLLAIADGLAVSPDERFLYVGDESLNRIVRVNRRTGGAITLASGFDDVTAITQLRDGGFLAGDGAVDDLINRVPRSGSPVTLFSDDPDYEYPHDIVVEPAACGGRLPTVVGTDRAEVIKGSRFADVISTLGGNDVVRGLGGNDLICGGKGRDRLLGGKGRDRLLGGPGRDRLIGGLGRDRLRGGPGRDAERQ